MTTFAAGGVAEPMNLPWESAIAAGTFAREGFAMRWVEQPGGTGAIAAALIDGSLDVATILTEGAVAAIVNGAPLRIHSLWVLSPLVWGIHVAGHNPATSVAAIDHVRFAVSRLGSGSHLMAYLVAAREGRQLADDQLVVVGDIDGARAALAEGRADVFLWEKYVTAPLVHRGELRRIDTIETPWPSFAIAAHVDTLTTQRAQLDRAVVIARRAALRFAASDEAVSAIVTRYGMTDGDAAEWLATYSFARTDHVAPATIDAVQQRLRRVGAIHTTRPAARLLA
jgi:ABC-type nitrate/sulfonate/bicarbonate transport system substrate-binding protein